MNKSYIKPVVLLVGFVTLMLLLRKFGILNYFTIANMQAKSADLTAFVQAHYVVSILAYIVIYTGLIACALPILAPMTFLGGYLFGAFQGTLFGLLSATSGSMIYFLIMRYVFANTVRERFASRFEPFKEKMNKYGATYLVILQVLAVVPFFVINSLAIMGDLSFFTVLWTTIVGGLPVHFVFASAGKELTTMKSFGDILNPTVLVLLVLIALLVASPMIIGLIRNKLQKSSRG